MAFDEFSHSISNRGQDGRGLGCWSWMELSGIGGLITSSGLGGCYSQHLTYMSQHRDELESSIHFIPENIACPRQLF